MEKVTKFLESKRTSYRQLPLPIRIVITGIVSFIGIVGVIFIFTPLSDIGVLFILLALGVLSFEFSWAKRLLDAITKKLSDKKFVKKLYATGFAVFILFVLFAVYWLFLR